MGHWTTGTLHSKRMAGALLFLLSVVVIVSAVAAIDAETASASIDDDWSFDDYTKELTYSGPVKMPNYTDTENPIKHLNASSATSVKFNVEVTRIGDFAFYGSSLGKVVIPEDVTYIGKSAFSMCTSLNTLTVYDSVTEIGERAFYNCSKLKSVTMPSTVTSIGAYSFAYCSSLSSVTLPPYDETRYPEGELTIGGRAFYGCSSLTSIYIPMNVATIPEYAFYGCSSIATIEFQEIPVIDPDTEKATIYESKIIEFGDYAFYGCSNVKTIQIPDKLQTLGKDVFGETSSLESITTRDTSTVFRSSDGVLFDMGLSNLYHYPSAKGVDMYTVPSSVSTIDDTAFNGAKELTSISIGNSNVYYSENGVLFSKDMSSLIRYPEGKTDQSYSIPSSVSYVRTNAFHGATHLYALAIPVTSITFMKDSLSIGSPGNMASIVVDVPDGYSIPKSACGAYTNVYYLSDIIPYSQLNTIAIIAIIVVIVVIIIVIVAVVIILKKKRV